MFSFHTICLSLTGQSDLICKPSFLKLFLQSTTNPNFKWNCDSCLTKPKENKMASFADKISNLTDQVDKLKKWERSWSNSFKQLNYEQFEKLIRFLSGIKHNTHHWRNNPQLYEPLLWYGFYSD